MHREQVICSRALEDVAQTIIRDVQAEAGPGAVTDKVPALAEVDPGQLGIAILTRDGDLVTAGDVYDRGLRCMAQRQAAAQGQPTSASCTAAPG